MLAIKSSEEESTEMEEMDTSEPNWCWFYLAECGVWHMFEVVHSAFHYMSLVWGVFIQYDPAHCLFLSLK